MRRLALSFSLFLVLSTTLTAQRTHTAGGSRSADPFSGLDTAFARILKDWHAAGFAVAVIKKDSVIYARGFGYRDIVAGTPVTPHTLFAIGSCTKAFTSSLIGMLDHQGLLSIDKPVRNYLPELKFYNQSMDDGITLRDMMCHRTGLPRYDLSWYFFAPGSRDSLLQRIRYMEPTYDIHQRWQYNNFMFLAQGMVVEKLTKQSWENNITEKLLKPLGMNETVLSVKDLAKGGDVSLGYGLKKDSIIQKLDYHDLYDIAPAGALNSSILDMASWVITWINAGKYQGKEILPSIYVRQAMDAQMVIGDALPSKETPDVYFSDYGFGWSLSSYRGHYRVEHGGNIDGFSASTCFFPSDSIGIVVLSNQSGSQVPSIVRNLVADRLLHLEYKDWNSWLKKTADEAKKNAKQAMAAKVSDYKPGTHPSHPLSDYTGLFVNPAYGGFEIVLQKDSLLVNMPQQVWWLKHYHYDVFEPFDRDPKEGIDTSDHPSTKMVFGMNEAGEIENITMNLDAAFGKPVVFTRTPKPVAVTADQLQKYTGEYVLGNLTTKVYIKNNTLYLFVPGQPEYELSPLGKDKFALKALNGFYAQFVLDDKGETTALMAIQPNGTFKATRKK